MKHTILSSIISLSLTGGVASAQVIVDEDFESYGDTASMLVNWAGGVGTLDTGFGNPGQSAAHLGGTVNSWVGSSISVAPSATEFIRLTADIYDDGSSANKRITVGLRNGANPLFEMGMYNSLTTGFYSVRILNFSGSPGSADNYWVAIPDQGGFVNAPVAGWHRWTAEIYDTYTTISLDLQADGSVDATYTSFGAASANPFIDLRFGGPSNLSSPGGGAQFDNILLEVLAVPEPTTLSLLGLGCAALIGFRSRR